MNSTERLFIIILILTGLIFFYILSIFFQPLKKEPTGPPLMDGIVIEEEYEDSEPEKSPRYYSTPSPAGISSYSELPAYNSRSESDPELARVAASLEIPPTARIKISLEERQKLLRESLIDRGYSNPYFLKYMEYGLDNQIYLDAKPEIEKMLKEERFGEALRRLIRVLDATEMENLQVRSFVLEKILEVALMGGDLRNFELFSAQYYDVIAQTLDVFKNSRLMDFHAARDKVYELSKAVDIGRSGGILQFLGAIKSGQISPLEIVTGLKVASKMQGSGSGSGSEREMAQTKIDEAAEGTLQLFKRFQ